MAPIVMRFPGDGRDWASMDEGATSGAAIAADAEFKNWRRVGVLEHIV